MKDKEYAISDWFEMIEQSWKWEKLTNNEQRSFHNAIARGAAYITGNYTQRWNLCNLIYNAFLDGCGYSGMFWRAESEVLK